MYKIIEYDKLKSTNKFALKNINNFDSGTIIKADIQEAGRGRFSRKWISDKRNNCYISFILKPEEEYRNVLPNLTQYLSVVLCNILNNNYSIKSSIKWPNDVQVNGKKIAGILSEVSFEKGRFNGIVLGIGVNLNLDKSDIDNIDIPATSLNLELNQAIDSNKFINELAICFFERYDVFLEKGFKNFRAEYISYTNFLGQNISIKNPDMQNLGTAIDICEDGTLQILSPNGEIKNIISGDLNIN